MRALNTEPIVSHAEAAACVATRNGAPIAADRFVADVIALAARLGPGEHVLNICRDRYAFAVSFCAALVAGRTNLLPPSRTPQALRQLAAQYPSLLVVGDGDAASERVDGLPPPLAALRVDNDAAPAWPPPQIARDHIAAIAFTSGSTGTPQPQPKRWGGIVDGARAEIDALGLAAHLPDTVLVGTVSAQHMYGLESTVLLALHGPCAFAAEHPLHPAEVIDTLARQRGARVLITTPVHLRALADAAPAPPRLACVVSATAPLAVELASKCESTWATQVMEVYGCTETGMVATRRTTDGAIWQAMRDVRIEARGAGFWASGGHVAQPGPLADRLKLHDATRFELLGRADDIVNIGGKRASLQGLNRTLLEVPGVLDGVIFLPEAPDPRAHRELRLTALVVAPTLKRAAVLAALRARLDPVFLPRPLLLIDALPRNAQGKLPRAALLALVEQLRRGSELYSTRSEPRRSGATLLALQGGGREGEGEEDGAGVPAAFDSEGGAASPSPPPPIPEGEGGQQPSPSGRGWRAAPGERRALEQEEPPTKQRTTHDEAGKTSKAPVPARIGSNPHSPPERQGASADSKRAER